MAAILPLIGAASAIASTAIDVTTKLLAAKPAANGLDPATDARLRKTASDFETMFLENTVDRMLAQMGEEGPLGANGAGGDVWRSMLAKEHAKSMQKAGGIGLASSVYSELVRIQARASGDAPGGAS